MLLEELVAYGVKRAVFLGYCGAIQDHLSFGDIVLPTRAVREDGTSYHYLPQGTDCRPDRMLLDELHLWLERRDMAPKTGAIWTTDALYRETDRKIERYRGQGVLAVDMEMSALFAVGAVRGVGVLGLLLVSDQFCRSAWRPGFLHPVLMERENVVTGILVEWLKQGMGSPPQD
jgi:uridine phosphorylase